jgi:hypothetical protein
MEAQSLYPCGVSGPLRFDSGWLSEATLRRLLPVCCPAAPMLKSNRRIWAILVDAARMAAMQR